MLPDLRNFHDHHKLTFASEGEQIIQLTFIRVSLKVTLIKVTLR